MKIVQLEDYCPELTSDSEHPLRQTHIRRDSEGRYTLQSQTDFDRELTAGKAELSGLPVYQYRFRYL